MRQRTMMVMVAVALVAAACDSGPEPVRQPTAGEVVLRIVSGDGQVAQVAGGAQASLRVTAAAAQELLPEPLVVELVDTVTNQPVASIVATSGGGMLLEPTVSYSGDVPANLLVRFRVEEEGCGEPFIGTALPDSGRVVDRWVKGTKAGDCHMLAQRLIDGEPHTDTTFLWHAEPGPVATFWMDNLGDRVAPGDTVDLRPLVKMVADAHGNPIKDLEGRTLAWAMTSRVHGDPLAVVPDAPDGEGGVVVVPDPADRGYEVSYTGDYAVRLWLWVDGVRAGEGAAVDVVASGA